MTLTMKLSPEKNSILQILLSIQVSLHREPPEVELVKKLTESLYYLVEQHVPTLHRECYRIL